ncbi:MAG: hypothetical protein RA162_00180 [Arsenophonus sp.]|nr:MAG: hypothetical protein RA162_00180 [Arsenophonus sp.]
MNKYTLFLSNQKETIKLGYQVACFYKQYFVLYLLSEEGGIEKNCLWYILRFLDSEGYKKV